MGEEELLGADVVEDRVVLERMPRARVVIGAAVTLSTTAERTDVQAILRIGVERMEVGVLMTSREARQESDGDDEERG